MNKHPTALLEAKGAFVKDPQRKRKGEPKPRAGIGKAPEKFSTDFDEVWDEVVDNICPGVLGNSDRIHLEMTVNTLIEYRRDPAGMSASNKQVLKSLLGHMGMNPVDRTRIVAEQKEQQSKEDAYFS